MMNTLSTLLPLSLSILMACALDGSSEDRAPFVSAGALDGVNATESESGSTGEDGGETSGGLAPDDDDDIDEGETMDTTGEPAEPESCGAYTFIAPDVTTEVMFVLDRSSSMVHSQYESYGPIGDGEADTRWQQLHEFVSEVIDGLDDDARVGAVLFPSVQGDPDVPGSECEVDDEPTVALGEHGSEIVGEIPSANAKGFFGATPMRAAIEVAAAQLMASESEAPRALVLVTDGAASCASGADDGFLEHDDAVPAMIEALQDEGISTFVVGIDVELDAYKIPEVNPYAAISKLAVAGGRRLSADQSYFDVSTGDELAAGFLDMAREVQCVFVPELDGHPLDSLELTLAGEALQEVDACAHGSGWRAREGADGDVALELCAAACELFASGGALEIDVPCDTD